MAGLLEKDVGLKQYIGTHKGFSAILKFRYQDFLVNEIDKCKNSIHLTCTECSLDEGGENNKSLQVKILTLVASANSPLSRKGCPYDDLLLCLS